MQADSAGSDRRTHGRTDVVNLYIRFGYELNIALENLKHLSLIFGYLLENRVWKSDDFS